MKTNMFQSGRLQTALPPLILACLASGLGSCASHPAKSAAQAQAETALDGKHCEDGNAKPDIDCAKSPAAAFDQNGRLWAAWGQGGKVYVNHSNDLGKTFSAPVAVNGVAETIEASGEIDPKIALSKSGGVYVAWTSPQAGHVRFSRSLDGGKTFTTPIQADGGAATGHALSDMAVNSRDYIYLALTDPAGKPGAALYFAYSSDGGRGFHPEKKIAEPVCGRASIKLGHKQWPVLLWEQGSGGHALTRFVGKDQPGTIQPVGGGDGKAEVCPHHGPTLSVTPKEDYYLAWPAQGGTGKGLYFSASPDQGKTFLPPQAIGHAAAAAQPDILADDRSIHVTWTESDGKKTSLLEQSSFDGGQAWSAPRTLAETEGDSDQPFLLAYQGHHYVAWQTRRQGFRLIALGD